MSTKAGRGNFTRWLVRLIPSVLAVCGLVATFRLNDFLVHRDLTQLHERTEAESKHVAAQVRAGVLQAFDPLPRIAAWWLMQGPPLAADDWDLDSQLLLKNSAGLVKVAWIDPDGKRTRVLRPGKAANAKAVEAPTPELLAAMEGAKGLNSLFVSKVFDADGKVMLYACFPVTKHGRLAGFVGGLYDAAELVRSVLDGQLPDDYSAIVWADGRQIPFGSNVFNMSWGGRTRETPVALSNASWSVWLTPSMGEVDTLRRLVISFGVLVSILLYGCASWALVARRRASELASANLRLILENQERKRAEEKIGELNRDLRRRLHEFHVLLEVLPVGIAVADDPECRNIWINRSMADLLKVPMGVNISKSAQNANKLPYKLQQQGVDVPTESLPMQKAARTHSAVSGQELDIVREDGSVIHTLSYSAPVFDEHGSVRGVIDACVDITDRKRAEEDRRVFLTRRRELEQRIERAEKYRSLALMAGGVAHDFNNLLTVIIGNAHLISMDLPEQTGLAVKIAELLAAADHASELTSRLLAFTGRIWCNAKPIDLSAAVASMEPSIRAMVPSTVDLRYDLTPGLPLIRAGIPELQQVIQHLVQNAVEAMTDRPGAIEIRAGQCDLSVSQIDLCYPDLQLAPGHYVRLEVADEGCGIPEGIANRVFDPFFTTKFVGRGLGLSAVQGIVRAHGGGVRLDSKMQHGTRVEIILPAHSNWEIEGDTERPELALK